MKFSIRELLILAVLCALGMLAFKSHRQAKRQEQQTAAALAKLERTRQVLLSDQPAAYAAKMCELDGYAAIAKIRAKSEQHFKTLQDKYGSITPRGDEVLSMRTVPTLRSDRVETPIAFGVFVPKNRNLWLKYGVHPTERNTQSARSSDTLGDLVSESPFEHNGPYELKLQSGEQIINVDLMYVANGKLPFQLKLDEQVLIDSAFQSEEVRSTGHMSIWAESQVDFKKKRRLPTVMTINMTLSEESIARDSWGFSIWLSDRSSDFAAFPHLGIVK